jgi:hypothetical protein
MKMKFLIMYFFCSIIVFENINALSSQNQSRHHSRKSRSKKQNIRPNVHDIKRFLKPMISPPEQAYIPKEVSSLGNYDMKSDRIF